MSPGKLSQELYARACRVSPGGVNSPVRAFGAVGGQPFFTASGRGCRLEDVDGSQYIDYVLSWGPLIRGHSHKEVTAAVDRALNKGTHFGTPTPAEVELAEKVCALVPSIEMVRFVNSGTEAMMSAVRLARAVTGRDLILKFEGCYHGHGDGFLVKAGSGLATLGLPSSPGVPRAISELTLTVAFNDRDAVAEALARHAERLAAVIVEPVVGNAGLIPPEPGFLEFLREGTTRVGALLIFDEVMTGFRVALAEIMARVAPEGDVYQAGTLSGNPVAMAAGLAQLRVLERENPFALLEGRASLLVEGICKAARDHGIAASGAAVGSMWGVYFCEGPVRSFQDASCVDRGLFSAYHRECLAGGVFFAPSPFEAGFISTAHGDVEVGDTLDVVDRALAKVGGGR